MLKTVYKPGFQKSWNFSCSDCFKTDLLNLLAYFSWLIMPPAVVEDKLLRTFVRKSDIESQLSGCAKNHVILLLSLWHIYIFILVRHFICEAWCDDKKYIVYLHSVNEWKFQYQCKFRWCAVLKAVVCFHLLLDRLWVILNVYLGLSSLCHTLW